MEEKDYPVHHEEHEIISPPSLTSKKFTTEQKIEKLTKTRDLLQKKINELIAFKAIENLDEYREKYNEKYFKQQLGSPNDFCYFYIKNIMKNYSNNFLVSGIRFAVRNAELFTYFSCGSDIEDFEVHLDNCTEVSKEEFRTFLESLKEQTVKNLDDIEVKLNLKGE